ncbi:MAG: hypothetical protein Q8M92_02380 [Candidatus Subteraquimicrobiales bacterium]|nr:hypothetical protein [Candidatus Subteraquimicrobiales bacterium]
MSEINEKGIYIEQRNRRRSNIDWDLRLFLGAAFLIISALLIWLKDTIVSILSFIISSFIWLIGAFFVSSLPMKLFMLGILLVFIYFIKIKIFSKPDIRRPIRRG